MERYTRIKPKPFYYFKKRQPRGDTMKNVVLLTMFVLVLALPGLDSSVAEGSLPLLEAVELKKYDDHYMQGFPLPVLVKKDSTYEIEDRMVQIQIRPQKYRVYQKGGQMYGEKDYFLKVLVSIVLGDEDNPSKEFKSYLNFEVCPGDEGRLFWDHAGEDTADNAGRTFDQDHPLTVHDTYIKVTVKVTGFSGSLYPCTLGYDLYCESDSDCLYYMDTLTLLVTVEYTPGQKELQSSFEDANEYIQSANEYSAAGEFEKAKEEYEKAKAIYEEESDIEKADDVKEQIDFCDSYITGQEQLDEGMKLFKEAVDTEDYKEAIEKYEKARSYFERAKKEFDDVEDTAFSDMCQDQIDKCDDEIENLESVGALRNRLLYIIVIIVVIAGVGIGYNWLKKGKPQKAQGMMMLVVENTETGKTAVIHVSPFDKIGKVRQKAGTQLGIVPYEFVYQEKTCPPDQTVEECGLTDGDVAHIVPTRTKPEELETEQLDDTVVQVLKEREEPQEPEKVPPSEKRPRLIFENQAFYLTKDSTTIGRGEAADITIPDPKRFISRIHAKIYKDKGDYYIKDNDSANGTFIYKDGQHKKIKKMKLSDGDVIVLSYKPSRGAHITLKFKEP
jgi:tetratricopeptide (TPR) repeat protein